MSKKSFRKKRKIRLKKDNTEHDDNYLKGLTCKKEPNDESNNSTYNENEVFYIERQTPYAYNQNSDTESSHSQNQQENIHGIRSGLNKIHTNEHNQMENINCLNKKMPVFEKHIIYANCYCFQCQKSRKLRYDLEKVRQNNTLKELNTKKKIEKHNRTNLNYSNLKNERKEKDFDYKIPSEIQRSVEEVLKKKEKNYLKKENESNYSSSDYKSSEENKILSKQEVEKEIKELEDLHQGFVKVVHDLKKYPDQKLTKRQDKQVKKLMNEIKIMSENKKKYDNLNEQRNNRKKEKRRGLISNGIYAIGAIIPGLQSGSKKLIVILAAKYILELRSKYENLKEKIKILKKV
ncbi:hypothetical protein GVAV_003496 [Gurleya vavrai]